MSHERKGKPWPIGFPEAPVLPSPIHTTSRSYSSLSLPPRVGHYLKTAYTFPSMVFYVCVRDWHKRSLTGVSLPRVSATRLSHCSVGFARAGPFIVIAVWCRLAGPVPGGLSTGHGAVRTPTGHPGGLGRRSRVCRAGQTSSRRSRSQDVHHGPGWVPEACLACRPRWGRCLGRGRGGRSSFLPAFSQADKC